jgi:hypothetical protein
VTLPSNQLLLICTGVVALLVLGAAVATIAYRRHRARRALLDRIEAVASEYLRDVLLPDGNGGWFHVDFLLLTSIGLVVLDLRDFPGMVFGSEQMVEWTVIQKQRRLTFPNPLGPLYDRLAVVRALAGEGVPVEGRVVFTDKSSFPKGHPAPVLRLASLAAGIARPVASAIDAWRPAWERVSAASSPSPSTLRRS